MKRLIALLLCLLSFAFPAAAKPIVSDLSNYEINIQTSFSGTELILFGARNDAGDIVVVVRGPERNAIVRRKKQTFGMWINGGSQSFQHIPSFYAIASSRPFEDITKSTYFPALGIGFQEAIGPAALSNNTDPKSVAARALLQDLRQKRLYGTASGEVTFVGETLFKATIPFPDDTPRGAYTAEVYLFSGGLLTGAEVLPINVRKIGFDARVYNASQHHPFLYGFVAVAIALLGGWLASTLFSRF